MANIRGYSPCESKYDILPVIYEGKIVVQCQGGQRSVLECGGKHMIIVSQVYRVTERGKSRGILIIASSEELERFEPYNAHCGSQHAQQQV